MQIGTLRSLVQKMLSLRVGRSGQYINIAGFALESVFPSDWNWLIASNAEGG
jgi:hypothetical protein